MNKQDYITINAVLDEDTLLQQANLCYRAWETDRNGPNADLWMGIAAMLFHLHDGSYILKQQIEKANKGVY